jgi:hypothetical protein
MTDAILDTPPADPSAMMKFADYRAATEKAAA